MIGLEHALNVAVSSLQRKMTPPSVSVKLKLALVWFVDLVGDEVITGLGGAVVSMVQVKLAAPLWLPAASCASTENV